VECPDIRRGAIVSFSHEVSIRPRGEKVGRLRRGDLHLDIAGTTRLVKSTRARCGVATMEVV